MPEVNGISYQNHDGGAPNGQPPLLLIHGAAGSRLHWPSQIRRLEGAHVLTLDLPAHGQSGGHPEATVSGYAERVTDWMRALELDEAVLVGHSMGGAIALTIALRLPRKVAGLVLVGTSARLKVDPSLLQLSANRATFPQAVDRVVAAAFSPSTPPQFVEQARARMLETEAEVFHADFTACDRFDLSRRLGEIEVPATVVYGVDDRLTPPPYCRKLAQSLPAGSSVEVAAAGHMVMLERPMEVAAPVGRMLHQRD